MTQSHTRDFVFEEGQFALKALSLYYREGIVLASDEQLLDSRHKAWRPSLPRSGARWLPNRHPAPLLAQQRDCHRLVDFQCLKTRKLLLQKSRLLRAANSQGVN